MEPPPAAGRRPPSRFEFPVFNFKGDLWIPWVVDAGAASTDRAGSGSATVVGRLRDGTTIDAAAAEMHAVMRGTSSSGGCAWSAWAS